MNSTQKKIIAFITIAAAIIIAIAWAEKAVDSNSWSYHWYDFGKIDRSWYAFLLPFSGAAFILFKLFSDKKD